LNFCLLAGEKVSAAADTGKIWLDRGQNQGASGACKELGMPKDAVDCLSWASFPSAPTLGVLAALGVLLAVCPSAGVLVAAGFLVADLGAMVEEVRGS